MVQIRQVQYVQGEPLVLLTALIWDILANAWSPLVWMAAKEEQDAKQAQIDAQRRRTKEETRVQREEMRKEMLGEK